jgi:solute carrier family 12 (sodium/potassium/chloride transporter), member 2
MLFAPVEGRAASAIPLYLANALATAMHIFGFREGWQWIFTNHSAVLVYLIAFLVLLLIASMSAKLTFRIQFLIMAVIAASLLSILVAALQAK